MHGRPASRVGPYVLGPKAGAGGMGVVFQAEHATTGARHAVKCLLPGAPGDDVLRFRREAEAMARVDGHPHVLRVHSVGVEPGGPWLAMEWAPGGSLADRLVRGPLPIDEAVSLGRALASGLAHVHRHGVLHRDLKPANVLFDEAGRAKLTDFGLARVVGAGSLTESGTILGTPAYMAPEQAQASKALDARTDVYGLGALLYHALTGRPPFTGTSAMAVLSAVLERAPVAPRSLRADVPAWLEAIVLRALAKEPGERFSDMDDLGAALAAGGARESSRPVVFAAVAAGVAAVVCGAGALALVLSPKSDARLTDVVPAAVVPSAAVVEPTERPTPVAPAWCLALEPERRPPLPLPAGLRFADVANEYVNEKDGSTLVWVPPAEFVMGLDGPQALSRDGPAHPVRLTRGYFVGKLEVSAAQLGRFLDATGDAASTWTWAQRVARSDLPALGVSWHAAQAYCAWAGLRLPSEAEWELAARGTDGRLYPWGDEPPTAERCNCASTATGPGAPDVVGARPAGASPFGCLDLAGNALEWVQDAFAERYREGPQVDPKGPREGEYRVVRGGAFDRPDPACRAVSRLGRSPETNDPTVGFRVARSSS